MKTDRVADQMSITDVNGSVYRQQENIKVYICLLYTSFSSLSNLYCSSTHTKALVSNHQLDPIQATAAEPLEEADPAGFVLFHAFGGAKNLTVSVPIHRDGHQNGYIFKLSAPVAAQIDPIHIDIRISSTLQRTVSPILNMDIRFLVQLADGRWRHLATPQSLCNCLLYTSRCV